LYKLFLLLLFYNAFNVCDKIFVSLGVDLLRWEVVLRSERQEV